jgi:putative transposase
MDEVFIRIRGKQHYLWRAVDQDGKVLDILVQSGRSAAAAKRFLQAAEELAIRSAGDRDRQAQELRRRPARDPASRRAPPKPIPQQSS